MGRNTLLKRIFAVVALIAFLAVSVITVFPLGANAQDAQTKIKNSQAKQSELKDKINQTDKKISENTKVKQQLDSEIDSVQAEINVLNGKISKSNSKIAEKQKELEKAEKASQKQYSSYTSRAKMMVERGSITYLEVILNAKSFSDLLSRISIVKQIVEYDSNRLSELKQAEQKIIDIKGELEKEKQNLVKLKADETAQMQNLSQKRNESQKMIDSLKGDKAAFEKALQEQEAAEAAVRAEIARQQQSRSDYSSQSSGSYSGGSMLKPTAGGIGSPYGYRIHPITGKRKMHTGVDIGGAYGADIIAAESGTVIIAGYNAGGYGNYVVVDHGGGITTLYAHASVLCVSRGQSVGKGQVIAKVGSTGMSTGPHLHFEVHKNGAHTNPMNYIG